MNIGMALSGGGVKGAAHIGALQALSEHAIRPGCLSGSSAGSIVAVLYAAGYTPRQILDIFLQYVPYYAGGIRPTRTIADPDFSGILDFLLKLLSRCCGFTGFLKGQRLCLDIHYYLKAKGINTMRDFKMPVAVTALDLNSGEEYYFSNIKFSDRVITDIPAAAAVRASCAIPVVFRPVRYKDKLFVDGGVLDNTPVECLRCMGSTFNMALRFDERDAFSDDGCASIMAVADRSIYLLRSRLQKIGDMRSVTHRYRLSLWRQFPV